MKSLRPFDNKDPCKHDQEIQEGAPEVLFQKLVFVMGIHQVSPCFDTINRTPLFQRGDVEEELAMICCSLSMVYRANTPQVLQSMEAFKCIMFPILDKLLHEMVNNLTIRPFARRN